MDQVQKYRGQTRMGSATRTLNPKPRRPCLQAVQHSFVLPQNPDLIFTLPGCYNGAHTYCLNLPPVEQLPDEDWFCDACRTWATGSTPASSEAGSERAASPAADPGPSPSPMRRARRRRLRRTRSAAAQHSPPQSEYDLEDDSPVVPPRRPAATERPARGAAGGASAQFAHFAAHRCPGHTSLLGGTWARGGLKWVVACHAVPASAAGVRLASA